MNLNNEFGNIAKSGAKVVIIFYNSKSKLGTGTEMTNIKSYHILVTSHFLINGYRCNKITDKFNLKRIVYSLAMMFNITFNTNHFKHNPFNIIQ